MSDSYSISVGLDYRNDGKEHEVEINYWDSEDNEACGSAKGKSFEDAANKCFEDLIENMASQVEDDDEDEYVSELESWLTEVEDCRDALLEENERLEHRITQLQEQVRQLQERPYTQTDYMKTGTPQTDYIKVSAPSCKTSTAKADDDDAVESFLRMFHKLGLL